MAYVRWWSIALCSLLFMGGCAAFEQWKAYKPKQDYGYRVLRVRENLHMCGPDAALQMVVKQTEATERHQVHPINMGELPLWWRERASLEAMLGRHREAARHFDRAWQLLDERQIAAAGDNRHLFFDSWQTLGPAALPFVPPVHEDMMLPLLAAASRSAAGDDQGALVEVRRFEMVRQRHRRAASDKFRGLGGFSWLAARISERIGDHQRMWRHEEDAGLALTDPTRLTPLVVLVHHGHGPRKRIEYMHSSFGHQMVQTFKSRQCIKGISGLRPSEALSMARCTMPEWFTGPRQTYDFDFAGPVLMTEAPECEPELRVDGEPVHPEAFVGVNMLASRAWVKGRRMTVGLSYLQAKTRHKNKSAEPWECYNQPARCGLDSRHWGLLPGALYGYAVHPDAKVLELVGCGQYRRVALRGDGTEAMVQLWSRRPFVPSEQAPAPEMVD